MSPDRARMLADVLAQWAGDEIENEVDTTGEDGDAVHAAVHYAVLAALAARGHFDIAEPTRDERELHEAYAPLGHALAAFGKHRAEGTPAPRFIID